MECNSTITFDTKSENKAILLGQAFRAFEGINPSSWDDLDLRKDTLNKALKESGVSLEAEEIYKHFVELDTGVSESTSEGTVVSIDIFPWDFPEELCKWLFPLLEKSGFDNISCNSRSEYGNQLLTFQNSEILKKEEMFNI